MRDSSVVNVPHLELALSERPLDLNCRRCNLLGRGLLGQGTGLLLLLLPQGLSLNFQLLLRLSAIFGNNFLAQILKVSVALTIAVAVALSRVDLLLPNMQFLGKVCSSLNNVLLSSNTRLLLVVGYFLSLVLRSSLLLLLLLSRTISSVFLLDAASLSLSDAGHLVLVVGVVLALGTAFLVLLGARSAEFLVSLNEFTQCLVLHLDVHFLKICFV